MNEKQEQLSQREWDRIVGWGKTLPPRKAKKKAAPPFTNHKATLERYPTHNKND